MAPNILPKQKIQSRTFDKFIAPLLRLLSFVPKLLPRGDRPLKMNFEEQLKALVYFHLQEHKSARHLIQDMKENDFAKENIAPEGGISRSSFSEIINGRGLEQLQFVFENLYKQALKVLPKEHKALGDLISIDGSLIEAVLSMYWADYRKGAKKAKGHFGFNINSGIPGKVYLTAGNTGERPFVSLILSKGLYFSDERLAYSCGNLLLEDPNLVIKIFSKLQTVEKKIIFQTIKFGWEQILYTKNLSYAATDQGNKDLERLRLLL